MGMKFSEIVNAELWRQDISVTKLSRLVTIPAPYCMDIVVGKREPIKAQADRICELLGIEYDTSVFKERENSKEEEKPKRKATSLEENSRRAAELGLSYGQYMTYLSTGTLDAYIERQKKDRERKYNAIVSSIGGGRGGGIANRDAQKL